MPPGETEPRYSFQWTSFNYNLLPRNVIRRRNKDEFKEKFLTDKSVDCLVESICTMTDQLFIDYFRLI